MLDNLDNHYGRLIAACPTKERPNGFSAWETLPPRSLSKLEPGTVGYLIEFMMAVESAWRVGNLLVARATILWIVDAEGCIWFAIEEAVEGEDPSSISDAWYLDVPFSALDRVPLLRTEKKLGHPSLVSCRAARIAGEIYFGSAPDGLAKKWIINASSGRYGVWVPQSGRSLDQLRNVHYRFLAEGVNLTIDPKGF